MKKRIKLFGIVMIITILLSTNAKAVTINETARVAIVFDNELPYHYEAEEKVNYKMLTYNGTEFYTLENSDFIMALITNADICKEVDYQRILENGYPVKTCEELGVRDEQEAYFATQEAIYAYRQAKDTSKYIAEDEQGERILNATKQILENANIEEVALQPVDLEWKQYDLDTDFMYQQYKILLNNNIENTTIELENASDVKIRTQDGNTISTLTNGDIIKIIVPKGINQNFKLKLIYEKEGAIVKECYNSTNTSIKYLAAEEGQVQREVAFEVEFKNLAPVIITNYDNDTKEKIGGSVFTILNESYSAIKENLATNEEGTIQTFLEKGKYFVKQTQVKEGYFPSKQLIGFEVKNLETVTLNIYNAKEIQEETNNKNTQINITQENKKVVENNVTDVTNIHNTDIEKEITYQTNETNFENVNYFVNTTYRKNINHITRKNTYQNKTYKEMVTNMTTPGRNEMTNMTRDEYITYMDYLKTGTLQVPNLPVALKQ